MISPSTSNGILEGAAIRASRQRRAVPPRRCSPTRPLRSPVAARASFSREPAGITTRSSIPSPGLRGTEALLLKAPEQATVTCQALLGARAAIAPGLEPTGCAVSPAAQRTRQIGERLEGPLQPLGGGDRGQAGAGHVDKTAAPPSARGRGGACPPPSPQGQAAAVLLGRPIARAKSFAVPAGHPPQVGLPRHRPPPPRGRSSRRCWRRPAARRTDSATLLTGSGGNSLTIAPSAWSRPAAAAASPSRSVALATRAIERAETRT